MRAFITAIILLCLIIALIIFNGIHINKIVDALLASLESANSAEATDRDIDEFEALWKKSRGSLILSTKQDRISKIDSLLNAMHICRSAQNVSGYLNSVSLLKETLLEIKRFEEFSLSNII